MVGMQTSGATMKNEFRLYTIVSRVPHITWRYLSVYLCASDEAPTCVKKKMRPNHWFSAAEVCLNVNILDALDQWPVTSYLGRTSNHCWFSIFETKQKENIFSSFRWMHGSIHRALNVWKTFSFVYQTWWITFIDSQLVKWWNCAFVSCRLSTNDVNFAQAVCDDIRNQKFWLHLNLCWACRRASNGTPSTREYEGRVVPLPYLICKLCRKLIHTHPRNDSPERFVGQGCERTKSLIFLHSVVGFTIFLCAVSSDAFVSAKR